jgi:pyruvate formate lyase activating enzyme
VRELLERPTVREALLYEKLTGNKVRCNLCERRCKISAGLKGFCKTRLNVGGRLFTLVYGDLSALESRSIEIKPFFHYWPGSTALTLSTWSCNFDCKWCQNHHLSKTEPNPFKANFWPPERVLERALSGGDEGLCVSFQEPTIMTDFAARLFMLGREERLYCCYVSNGYMTSEALRLLKESGMDGVKIDLKGDSETYKRYCGGVDVEKVWRNVREAKKLGLHVEVVNLIVTNVNDDEECLRCIINRHLRESGANTPLHFTRYYPAYKLQNPPTKVETLERAYEMAVEAGVLYPYIGNVRGHRYENTYCPNCGESLIRRSGYNIIEYKVTSEKRCSRCGQSIPITGSYVQKRS